jgi:hypothetical protein
MLWLERHVVAAMTGDDDTLHAGAISEFVATSLAAMPQHLRLGVALESTGLGTWVRLRHGAHPDPATIRRCLHTWERFPIGVVRQYPRLFSSLVLFAKYELDAR